MSHLPPSIREPRPADLAGVVLLGSIWGSAFLAIRIAVPEIGPLLLVLIRVVVAFLPIASYTLWRGDRLPGKTRDWWLIAGMSLLNTMGPFYLISWAELHIEAGVASLIMGIGPLGTMIAAHFTTPDDRFSGHKLLGMVLGFTGLGFVVGPSLSGGLGFDLLAVFAVWLGLICYVISGTMIRFVRATSVPMMTSINMAVATAVMLPLAMSDIARLADASPTALAATVYLGLVCTGLAYLLRTHLVVTIGQSYMSMASYFMPVVGVLLGWAVLGEPLTWQILVALVCVVAGFAVAKRRPVKASAADSATITVR